MLDYYFLVAVLIGLDDAFRVIPHEILHLPLVIICTRNERLIMMAIKNRSIPAAYRDVLIDAHYYGI